MPNKIPVETIDLIQTLYFNNGLSVKEVAREANVTYITAYIYTKVIERGYASYTEYQEHLVNERGYASYTEYRQHLAKEKGYASRTEYDQHLAKEKGYASRTEYDQHLAKEKGYASRTEYERHLTKKRQQKPLNQKLGHLVQQRLVELVQTQRWLAEQLGITQGAVSRYISGKTTPRKSLQEDLFNTLDLPYQTLDDIVLV